MSSIMRRRRGLILAIGGSRLEGWASTPTILSDGRHSLSAHPIPATAGSFNPLRESPSRGAGIRERGRLFVRPETPRPVAIRERHLAILANIARFGLANSAQLAALDGGSEQNVTRELLA